MKEMQLSANLTRIVADPNYRRHNAAPDHRLSLVLAAFSPSSPAA